MYFDYHDDLLICTIDKVVSTTILSHFKLLASKREIGFISPEQSRDDTRDKFYALNRGTTVYAVEEARRNESMTSRKRQYKYILKS